MQNRSGIYPAGDRILVKPDPIETTTEGGIVLPDSEADRYALAQTLGVVVAVGPDAWIHHVDRGPKGNMISKRGYQGPFAEPGDRVCFAKFGGMDVPGKDGEGYRILNDVDVTAKVDKEVDFSGWNRFMPRTAYHRS